MDRIARADKLPGAPPREQMAGNRAALLGWRIVEAFEGRSRMEWTPTAELANPVGQVHGGYLGLIVEDVCTSGGSALEAVEAARAAGAVVERAWCAVDRRAGGREALAAAGVALTACLEIETLLQASPEGRALLARSPNAV